MVPSQLREMVKQKIVNKPAVWITFGEEKPKRLEGYPEIEVRGVKFPSQPVKEAYGSFKEILWQYIHGYGTADLSYAFDKWFKGFEMVDSLFSQKFIKLYEQDRLDVALIHDFQLLLCGKIISERIRGLPMVFRWHPGFCQKFLPSHLKEFIVQNLNHYNAVVVSTKKYREDMKRAGVRSPIYINPPFIPVSEYVLPSMGGISSFRKKCGITPKDFVIGTVARLDPAKNQKLIIDAVGRLKQYFPNVKAVLIGDGSFSSSKGGLGLSKGELWMKRLLEVAKENSLTASHRSGVPADVFFITEILNYEEIAAAYSSFDVFVLPSIKEGYGMVVLEAWLYNKPVLCTTESGVAEQIVDGENGLLIDPKKPGELADCVRNLLQNPELGEELGQKGRKTLMLKGTLPHNLLRYTEILSRLA